MRGSTATLPEKPLIVTFDDGYTCFDAHAWPALRARGMDATVFLVVRANRRNERLGERRDRAASARRDTNPRAAKRGRALRIAQCRRTDRLRTFPAEDARDELTRSRTQLSELLGRDVDVFAYPFSNQNGVVRELAREAGYRCAVRGKGRMNSRHNGSVRAATNQGRANDHDRKPRAHARSRAAALVLVSRLRVFLSASERGSLWPGFV